MALKKTGFYWSDRWQKVINSYKCEKCGKEFTDLNQTKPKLELGHSCQGPNR